MTDLPLEAKSPEGLDALYQVGPGEAATRRIEFGQTLRARAGGV